MEGPLCHHVHTGIKHSVHLFGAGTTLRQLLVQYPSVTDCSSASSAGVSAVNLATRHGSTKTWVSNLLWILQWWLFESLPIKDYEWPLLPWKSQCQGRRVVTDRPFWQHVGTIPCIHCLCYSLGLWRPSEMKPSPPGEASAIALPSASKQILSPWPQGPSSSADTTESTKHVEDSPLETCTAVAGPSPTDPCPECSGNGNWDTSVGAPVWFLWTVNQKACRSLRYIKWCLRPSHRAGRAPALASQCLLCPRGFWLDGARIKYQREILPNSLLSISSALRVRPRS